MKTLKYIPFVCALLIAISSCKKTDDGITPSLEVNPGIKNVDENQGSFTIEVASNVAWTASIDYNWATLTPTKGEGNGTIKVDYSKNTSSNSRNATILIKGANLPDKIISLTQLGITPTVLVSPSNQNVGTSAGSTTFSVTSNTAWTASSDQIWCSLSQTSGTGNAEIIATYIENTLSIQRMAKITFSAQGIPEQYVTVAQAAFVPSLIVTPQNYNVFSPAGKVTFTVTSNIAWTDSCAQNWVTINTGGAGNGEISANYLANTTQNTRYAQIVVSGIGVSSQVVTISQAAVVPVLVITPQNQTVTNDTCTTTFSVTSNIEWTASLDQTWCTLASPGGTGNGIMTVKCNANSSSSQRVANLTISGNGATTQTATITQKSAIPTDGLVAYYPFNGNANDESGTGNNGTVWGATLTTDRKGTANNAYIFNGVDNYINITHSSILNLDNFT